MHRQFGENAGAAVRSGPDGQCSAEILHPVLEQPEAEVALRSLVDLGGVQTDTVIDDPQQHGRP